MMDEQRDAQLGNINAIWRSILLLEATGNDSKQMCPKPKRNKA